MNPTCGENFKFREFDCIEEACLSAIPPSN